MDPFALAGLTTSIFGATSSAVDEGKSATSPAAMDKLRTKEILGGALIVGTGAVLSIAFSAFWPLLTTVVVVGAIVVIHEVTARGIL